MIEERINPIFGITAKEDAKKKSLQLSAAEKASLVQSEAGLAEKGITDNEELAGETKSGDLDGDDDDANNENGTE